MSTMYLKYSTWPPWYELSAMPSASSCSAARTTSSTRAVVAEVDHFRALRLDQPAHDVDRGVVAVEQAGGGDEAQRTHG
jgi:hypothetical protein